jgi:hypothetical protein
MHLLFLFIVFLFSSESLVLKIQVRLRQHGSVSAVTFVNCGYFLEIHFQRAHGSCDGINGSTCDSGVILIKLYSKKELVHKMGAVIKHSF